MHFLDRHSFSGSFYATRHGQFKLLIAKQREMHAPENLASPNTGASSRKEKKKQAKEERDRLKQVEKKKRRLEKALATAAAIRTELEKKKQRRKEEEQRLDEEGAALAEAVALQVLVEEEVDSLEESIGPHGATSEETDQSVDSKAEDASKLPSPGKALKNVPLDVKQQICYTYAAAVTSDEGKVNGVGKDLYHGQEVIMDRSFGYVNRDKSEEAQVGKPVISDWEILSNPRDNLKASSERAKAAELAAGMAAVQAVAALRIAEEARAEAEAAKKAAEAAISQVLDRRQLSNAESAHQVMLQPMNIEMERDELKARLEETERHLKEKTRQVAHLEQSLEDMTQYLLHLKAKLPLPSGSFEREGETSERGSTNLTESSGGAVDQ